jgi:hypothetical protein
MEAHVSRPTVRNNVRRLAVLGGLALLLAGSAPGWGYEEVAVTDGGTLTGRVTLDGPPPPSRIFHMVFSPNIEFCGKISDGKGNRLLKEFHVSGAGGLQGVVVAVVGVPRGKPFSYAPKLEIENCRIGPFVTPVRNRQPLTITNHDPITHDIQGYTLKDDYTFAMFNKPMTADETAAKQVRFRPGHYLFRTQCGVHDFMQSWGIAVGNPYFAVTDSDGRFTIPDLPPGVYDVIAWHPHMQVQARQVTIGANGAAELAFRFSAGEVDIPLHDLQTNYRLQTALDVRPAPEPTVELQQY